MWKESKTHFEKSAAREGVPLYCESLEDLVIYDLMLPTVRAYKATAVWYQNTQIKRQISRAEWNPEKTDAGLRV